MNFSKWTTTAAAAARLCFVVAPALTIIVKIWKEGVYPPPFHLLLRPDRVGPGRDAAQHGLTRRHDIRDTLIKNGNPAVCSLMLLLAHFHLLWTKQPDALKHFVFFLFFWPCVWPWETLFSRSRSTLLLFHSANTHTPLDECLVGGSIIDPHANKVGTHKRWWVKSSFI